MCGNADQCLDISSLSWNHFCLQALTFFSQDRDNEKRKGGILGEVPEVFQNRHFQVSIAGYKWVVPTALKTNKLSAKLLFKNLNAPDFEEILQTETVHGVSSPQFTKRVQFSPLQMSNSQTYAISSIFRLQVIVNSVVYTAVEFTMAQLLWDRTIETSMNPYVSTILGKDDEGGGMIFVNIIRNRPIDYPLKSHDVTFSIRTTGSLWKRVVESKISVAISVVAEKGRWSRIFASRGLRRPQGTSFSLDFPRFSIDRDELTAFNPRNPVRLQLYGVRAGNQVLLGFVQFVFAELFNRDTLNWFQTEYSYLHTETKLKKCQTSGTCSEVGIVLGVFSHKKHNPADRLSHNGTEYSDSTEDDSPSLTSIGTERPGLAKRSSSVSGTISGLSETGKFHKAPLREFVWFPEDGYESYIEEGTEYSGETVASAHNFDNK